MKRPTENTTTIGTLRKMPEVQPPRWITVLALAVCAAACSRVGFAQVSAPSILQIDTGNAVLYIEDTGDLPKFGTNPAITTAASIQGFNRALGVADILAVNGQPVTGTHVRSAVNVNLRTAPAPGQTIADTVRNGLAIVTFEILKSDGTSIGTIFAEGFAGGTAPPGSPSSITANNLVITGGTGAFLGSRGQVGVATNPAGVAVQRTASMTEDPANRRLNGGGKQRWVAYLVPMSAPQIVSTPGGPAVTHSSDFSLVTVSKPAAAGEVLSLFATGLGPTVPAVDPGKPFPSTSLAAVNSPIDVKVNGTAAEVLGAVGYPGSLDGYQVNFRVPPDAAKGVASVQVSAAWINGAPVSITIQ